MAPAKKLEPGSQWSHLDRDGDGIVSDEEIATEERMIRLADLKSDMENDDKKQDAQRGGIFDDRYSGESLSGWARATLSVGVGGPENSHCRQGRIRQI